MPSNPTKAVHAESDPQAAAVLETISKNALTPAFQPIVNLHTGDILACEMLTRLATDNPVGSTADFFEAADESGLQWEVEEAARTALLGIKAHWPEDRMLFLNCSPEVICDPRLLPSLASLFDRFERLCPTQVVLEITERSTPKHESAVLEHVELLRGEGYRIAIDDVGAGVNGLNRITTVRPGWLKLDRELIDHIDEDRAKRNLVKFMQNFARLSGVRIIAEGIERNEELATLIEIGIPYGQGYLLARPGDCRQTLGPSLVHEIRSAWSTVSGFRFSDPRVLPIGPLVQEAPRVESDQNAHEALRVLESVPKCHAVLVMRRGACLGACPGALLRSVAASEPDTSIASLVGDGRVFIEINATVTEAIEIASSLPPEASQSPMIVRDESHIMGVVLVRDLLKSASDSCRAVHTRISSSTGLPGRVRCEEMAAELIQDRSTRPQGSGPGPDMAIVDIKGFAEFNASYGFELGDDLIQSLIGKLASLVNRAGADASLGHLGNDEFLITASPGRITQLGQDLIEFFDSRIMDIARSERLPGEEQEAAKKVAIRVLVLIDAFDRASSLGQLLRRIRSLRSDPDTADLAPSGSDSVMIVDRQGAGTIAA